MTRIERETLMQICRMRAKVAKAEATTIAAQRKADFQSQLAAIYHFDNDAVWKQAQAAARDATRQAQGRIAQRCRDLGIPDSFAPSVSLGWYGRGENASASRRAELTRVAYTKIDQLEKEAKLKIERASVDIQTKLVAEGLESADAKAWLESMPTAEQLMPPINAAEFQKKLDHAESSDREADEDDWA